MALTASKHLGKEPTPFGMPPTTGTLHVLATHDLAPARCGAKADSAIHERNHVTETNDQERTRSWVSGVPPRAMLTLAECASEAGVSRRFLEKEICRGRLIATKLSTRICRIRRGNWERYLDRAATSQL